jgi:hypothetical protein
MWWAAVRDMNERLGTDPDALKTLCEIKGKMIDFQVYCKVMDKFVPDPNDPNLSTVRIADGTRADISLLKANFASAEDEVMSCNGFVVDSHVVEVFIELNKELFSAVEVGSKILLKGVSCQAMDADCLTHEKCKPHKLCIRAALSARAGIERIPDGHPMNRVLESNLYRVGADLTVDSRTCQVHLQIEEDDDDLLFISSQRYIKVLLFYQMSRLVAFMQYRVFQKSLNGFARLYLRNPWEGAAGCRP